MRYLIQLTILFTCFFYGCIHDTRGKINSLLGSGDFNDHLEAYYLIGETKDSSYIPDLFADIGDGRISHDSRFKGMSIYQCKITALKKISNLSPPNPITYKPDYDNIKFYKDWWSKQKYIIKKE